MNDTSEIMVHGFGDVLIVENWQKGGLITFGCKECDNNIVVVFDHDNKDNVLESRIIKCDNCNHEYQMIL